MSVIKSIMRLIPTRSAHHLYMLIFLAVLGFFAIYYAYRGSGSATKGSLLSSQTAVLTIWQPKSHARRTFPAAPLKVPIVTLEARKEAKSPLIIYLYPPPDWICDEVRKTGAWEMHIISPLIHYLLKDSELNLIDIGTMVGVYTLHVANLGRKVVGVDGSKENLLRLGQSLIDNKLEDRVILIHNIIDATYGPRYLNSVKAHVGAAFAGKEKKEVTQTAVEAITADDLLSVIPFKRAVLKVDIETHEYEMFQKSSKLFDAIDIPLVLMEYNAAARTRKSRNFIRNFMTSRNYFPFANIDSTTLLGTDDMKWPFDMVWRREPTLSNIR